MLKRLDPDRPRRAHSAPAWHNHSLDCHYLDNAPGCIVLRGPQEWMIYVTERSTKRHGAVTKGNAVGGWGRDKDELPHTSKQRSMSPARSVPEPQVLSLCRYAQNCSANIPDAEGINDRRRLWRTATL